MVSQPKQHPIDLEKLPLVQNCCPSRRHILACCSAFAYCGEHLQLLPCVRSSWEGWAWAEPAVYLFCVSLQSGSLVLGPMLLTPLLRCRSNTIVRHIVAGLRHFLGHMVVVCSS
jgi:hypothetical protein